MMASPQDRLHIGPDMRCSPRPAAAGPAAHFDRNESHVIYGTGHEAGKVPANAKRARSE